MEWTARRTTGTDSITHEYKFLTIIVSCQCNELRPSCRVKKKMLMKRTDGWAAQYAGVVV